MSNEIENIASVHLGKAGDGTVVKPYVTPDYIDPAKEEIANERALAKAEQ